MAYKFKPPYVLEGPIGRGRLFSFFKLRRGVTVLKINDQYIEYRFPSADILASTQKYYLGGSEYVVDDNEAAALSAAGYADNLTAI